MGMLDLLRGKKSEAPAKARRARPDANSTGFAASQLSAESPAAATHSMRKDLLKVVLREVLLRNGIPQAWVAADMLRTTSPRREQGLHVRFLVRHWEPRLLPHGPALEQEFAHRLVLMDPLATEWLMGFSWQFALDDTGPCPALPAPGTWIAAPINRDWATAHETKPGDIIEGPVVIPRPAEEVRADLARLMALRDADLKQHAMAGEQFAATRPASL
ncbi:MAG: hypothetical protein JWP60_1685 [Ramlibacter sp.]|nr:hypothetical protein [Ramlibacter sp.]